MDKPLRIRGLAMTTGMSRNFNIYTPEELKALQANLSMPQSTWSMLPLKMQWAR